MQQETIFKRVVEGHAYINSKTITYESESIILHELLEDFEHFLKACGYHFDGHIEIVGDEE